MSQTRIALVTGASSGIGRAAAIALHKAGWTVALTARNKVALETTAALMQQEDARGQPSVHVADLTEPNEIQALFDEVARRYSRLDLLFNNAGAPSPRTPIEDVELKTFTNIMNVNVTACFLCAQAAVRLMKQQVPMGGRIINNGSISAYAPRPHSAPYTISKHAILGLTRSLALDGREYDIACSQLDIGNASSTMSAHKSTNGALQANGQTMVEPVMDSQWAGDAVAYMAGLPLSVNVLNQTLMATHMPFVGRG